MTINAFSILLHVLSAVVWVGGMFFAYVCLRPTAAQQLEPPARLQLWVGVFSRFFPFVWLSVLFLPLTGYLMIFTIWGNFAATPLYVHVMNGTGILMILIYMHVFFAPFKRLKLAVAAQDWPDAGNKLNQIRGLIRINLTLGLITVVIASGGRYFV